MSDFTKMERLARTDWRRNDQDRERDFSSYLFSRILPVKHPDDSLSTLVGRSHSFICTYFRESTNSSSACSLCTSVTVHITSVLGQPNWLPADARISWILHASVSTLLPPLPLPPVSLVSYNCTLLLDHFTLVPASVSCHSHPVGAGRKVSVQSLVWAFCPELAATSRQECNNHRNVLVGSRSYLFDLE